MAYTDPITVVAPASRNGERGFNPRTSPQINVPFMRPELGQDEIAEVVDTLQSGWLTTGPKVNRFETLFARAVNAPFAVAVNSCTAALHLAVEALALRAGQAVLVPTMTFAATSEVVLYNNAIPILVDCDPVTGNMDLNDARRKMEMLWAGKLESVGSPDVDVVGIIPVHVGGMMLDIAAVHELATEFGLWVVEDAAHAFPSAWRTNNESEWRMCGDNTADVTCFSFYANKTITTGEGGMAVTHNEILAEKMRLMSLHGLSRDAWQRYSESGSWDYRIMAPGFKYNLTDIAAAIGIHQLASGFDMRDRREAIAEQYSMAFRSVDEIELPPADADRLHSWHLYPVRLRLDRLTISRNEFIEQLKKNGVGCSVHWRPLHLHPFYIDRYQWPADLFPNATHLWERVISLPLFPSMTAEEINRVVDVVRNLCRVHTKASLSLVA
ncbi:MAG TPA: DegT/DnrJ/EryC1/StrS aminotransferase family protein [Pyrinomonadaceae bacterium]